MDDPSDRYARLVAAWNTGRADDTTLAAIAVEAASLAEEATDARLRVMAAALGAAARAAGGGDLDVATILDAAPPAPDPGAIERLEALLPGPGPLAARLAVHDASTTVPADSLPSVGDRLVGLLFARAIEDLGLRDDVRAPTVVVGDATGRSRLEGDRVVLAAGRPWTIGCLVRAVSEGVIPGGYVADRLRPAEASWRPSPQTTVDHGMWTVGREVLLGDHELAHELGRIGRGVGLRWSGDLIVAVARARDDLAPAYAAAALATSHDPGELRALGSSEDEAARLLMRWEDPLARADDAARAAGPRLVRDWLVRVGQTQGLARLLGDRLTPSDLRADIVGG